MLDEARKRARHLIAELEKQKAEVDAGPRPANVTAEQFEQGRHAMIKAIASARRMLVSLQEAQRIADAPDEDQGADGNTSSGSPMHKNEQV